MPFKGPSSLITPTSLKSQNLDIILIRWVLPPRNRSPLSTCPITGSVSTSCSQMFMVHLGRWGNDEGLRRAVTRILGGGMEVGT